MLLHYLAKEGGIALLEVNPGLVLWTFIVFGIVLFLLHRFAWTPIAQALDARAAKVHGDIEQAEKLKEDAEQKLSDYLQRLEGLQAEGDKITQESRVQAEKQREELLAQAKTEAQTILEHSKREVLQAKTKALAEIHQQIVEVGTSVATQILGRQLNSEDHKQLALDAVKELKSLN